MIVETATEPSAVIDDATSFLDTLNGEATPLDYGVIEQYADLLGMKGAPPSTGGGSAELSDSRSSVPDELIANTPVQSRSPVVPSSHSQSSAGSSDDETEGSGSDDSSNLKTINFRTEVNYRRFPW